MVRHYDIFMKPKFSFRAIFIECPDKKASRSVGLKELAFVRD